VHRFSYRAAGQEEERTVENQTDRQANDVYLGHEIRVRAKRNALGAWVPDVRIYRDGTRIELFIPEMVSPEWLTEDEALRAGIEQGRMLVKHSLEST
jgi:hypothetical protein